MHKLITIPLLALYVFASLGIHGVSHFCDDKFIGVALFDNEDDMHCGNDSCCKVPENKQECCTDVQFALFYESESTLALIPGRYVVSTPAEPVMPIFTLNIQDLHAGKWKPHDIDDPGDISSIPLYISQQSLIFYG